MSLPVIEPVIKFHLSLNVADLPRSVAFYRLLFGVAPAKCHDDYAKFELDDPPLVFSLVPQSPPPGALLSHLGLRVPDEDALEQTRQRLEAAEICTQNQNGTVCSYTRQNKCWVQDPDRNFWEIYVALEDVDPDSVRRGLEGPAARLDVPTETSANGASFVVWDHFLTSPVPERIPHGDASVDEVRLTGTFNASVARPALEQFLRDVWRVLREGGKVVTHGLMADRPFTGDQPRLPGLASMVSRVPVHAEPIEMFLAAGFIGVQMVKFTEQPWFTHAAAELREVKVVAYKPLGVDAPEERSLLYKGPFREIRVDGGRVFPRGVRVSAPLALWQQLRLGAAAEHFLFLEPGESVCSNP